MRGWARGARAHWRTIAAYLALTFAIFALWNNILLVPFRVLTVFVHEAGHALAAILSGGRVIAIAIHADGSGLAVTQGGSALLIVSAGYLGSMLWGVIALGAAERLERPDRLVLLLALALAAVAILWVRPITGFGFGFCLVTAGLLAWAVREGHPALHRAMLRLVGLTSCLYALADLRREVFATRPAGSDASLMAELTGLPAWFWGIAWLGLALAIAAAFLRGIITPAPPRAPRARDARHRTALTPRP